MAAATPQRTIFNRDLRYRIAGVHIQSRLVDVVYVTMRFLSAKDKGEKKLFGFAFTPLMREDGTTLSDESHELYVYKVCKVLNMENIHYFCLRKVLSIKLYSSRFVFSHLFFN